MREVTIDVRGMTCASCVGRVQASLTAIPGVQAGVNLATEQAHVVAPQTVSDDDLLAAVGRTGYAASLPEGVGADEAAGSDGRTHEHGSTGDRLGLRLAVSAALTVPVVLVSMMAPLQFDGWHVLATVLAAPVVTWGAWPFHRAAAINARHGASTMDTLVSLGIVASYLWSLYTVLFGGELYLEVATAVSTFLLTGRYLEARAKRASGAALRALLDLTVKEVLLPDGRLVRLESLRPGDVFVVNPGARVGTDGTVLDGESEIDESLLTGESLPVEVRAGSVVTGGTVNGTGRLTVRATAVGAQTRLARISRLVQQAQAGQAPVQRLADRVSAVFVPVVLVLAATTFGLWLVFGAGVEPAFTAAVAVLIIACPCALGLATPTALLVGTGRGAQAGILIRGPQVLEDARHLDTVVLDKTGTLTTGRMSVLECSGSAEALALAAAATAASDHPVARAVAAAFGHPEPARDVRQVGGAGVEASVAGRRVRVGRPTWLEGPVPPELASAVAGFEQAGRSVALVSVDGAPLAAVALGDVVKPEAREAVAQLRALGLEPVLLTGDGEEIAHAVAAEVGVERVLARVSPEGKVAAVAALRAEGRRVAMVGDGVNDAAALAAASLGMAMGTGADAAIEAGDITLVRGDLRTVPQAVRLSRATLRTIKQNLAWAFGYNVAALPLAAFGLLDPMIAGAAMALSSLAVVTNSLRLRNRHI